MGAILESCMSVFDDANLVQVVKYGGHSFHWIFLKLGQNICTDDRMPQNFYELSA